MAEPDERCKDCKRLKHTTWTDGEYPPSQLCSGMKDCLERTLVLYRAQIKGMESTARASRLRERRLKDKLKKTVQTLSKVKKEMLLAVIAGVIHEQRVQDPGTDVP